MKYAVISDIHANLEAFLAVLEEIDSLRPDAVLCLGDIVGYGADPNECVGILIERGIPSIMGNHDAAASGFYEPAGFNPAARDAVLWTRHELTPENRAYLAGLPETRTVEDVILVHGAISDPDKYILSSEDALAEFELMDETGLCLFGHTHVAAHYRSRGGRIDEPRDTRFRTDDGGRHLVNPGSVGQPRDADPRAAYLVYDGEGTIELRRVTYDIEKARKKIIEKGLHPMLAERLAYGY